jgi:N-carbamoylputrescine amidase
VRGEDFHDTFALADPQGRIAGRVLKSVTADLEGRLFRGVPGPHVIATVLGRIGVGICQ